jgi:hypothetical protein
MSAAWRGAPEYRAFYSEWMPTNPPPLDFATAADDVIVSAAVAIHIKIMIFLVIFARQRHFPKTERRGHAARAMEPADSEHIAVAAALMFDALLDDAHALRYERRV